MGTGQRGVEQFKLLQQKYVGNKVMLLCDGHTLYLPKTYSSSLLQSSHALEYTVILKLGVGQMSTGPDDLNPTAKYINAMRPG